MKPEQAFGQIIKSTRIRKGYSQEQLAHSSDLDRTFISLLERGQRQPSLTSILRIAEALGIRADELLMLTMELVNQKVERSYPGDRRGGEA